MRNLFYFSLLVIFSFLSCNPAQKAEDVEAVDVQQTSTPVNGENDVSNTAAATAGPVLTLHDAEKILGEPADATENNTSTQPNIKATKLTYTAKSATTLKDKAGAIYLLLEEYKLIADAQNKYAFIKASNENSGGFKVLEGVGDEAYFHSDNENFYFIMARKGSKVLTMKVNKITKTSSLDAFKEVSKGIVSML